MLIPEVALLAQHLAVLFFRSARGGSSARPNHSEDHFLGSKPRVEEEAEKRGTMITTSVVEIMEPCAPLPYTALT